MEEETYMRRTAKNVLKVLVMFPILGAATGCRTIKLSEDSESVHAGETVVLEASPRLSGFNVFQWQKNGDDIPGATDAKLKLEKVGFDAVGFYRCRLSRSDETNEVDYTFQMALGVTGQYGIHPMVEGTPTSGPFQPGTRKQPGAPQPHCVTDYNGYVRLPAPAGGPYKWYWKPPAGMLHCKVWQDPPALGYTACIEVLRNDVRMTQCGTNSLTFSVDATKLYQFVLYIVSTPAPPTPGQALTLKVQWSP